MKISQSLLKGVLDYANGEGCGLVFKAKYIDRRFDLFPPSDAQNLGAWFEYIATGSIPKNGAIPQPKTLKAKPIKEPKPKKPKKLKKGEVAPPPEETIVKDTTPKVEVEPELGADYRLMLKHLQNFKNVMETYGFEILKVGEDIKVLYPDSVEKFGFEVWLEGTLDMRVRGLKDVVVKDSNGFPTTVLKKGQIAIVDLKCTGLLDDKWNPMGWNLSMLHDKIKIITQPIHYKFIELLKTGEIPPFLFLLFNVKDENDCRLIDFRFDESHFNEHKAFIERAVTHLLHYRKVGYEARPSMAGCAECPIKEGCAYKTTVPLISVYNLQ